MSPYAVVDATQSWFLLALRVQRGMAPVCFCGRSKVVFYPYTVAATAYCPGACWLGTLRGMVLHDAVIAFHGV